MNDVPQDKRLTTDVFGRVPIHEIHDKPLEFPRTLKLVAYNEAGEEIGRRFQHVATDDLWGLDAAEYAFGLKAKELFRDWLYASGKWEAYQDQLKKGGGSFWD